MPKNLNIQQDQHQHAAYSGRTDRSRRTSSTGVFGRIARGAARGTAAMGMALTLGTSAMVGTGIAGAQSAALDGSSIGDGLYNSAQGSMQGGLAMGSAEGLGDLITKPDRDPNGFYASIPTEVSGAPGTVLKQQQSGFTLGFSIPGWNNSRATRVAYVSTDHAGNPIPVTGTVLTSPAPWTGNGPRPLLALAPGTQGSGNKCAPSKKIDNGLGAESLVVAIALSKGWNVALTDLPGLGTPYQHTYMNRVNQGHATLDMARAAANLGKPGLTADNPVATAGYSQGGGGSAAALELAPTYAPELNLVAGFAGGVPADLAVTANAIDGAPLAGAMGYTINGLLETNPELRPQIEGVLNDKGKRFLADTADECSEQTLMRHGFTDSRTLTTTGESLGEIMERIPEIRAVISQQDIGNKPPQVPVFVGHGTNDDTIPVEQGRVMRDKWCAGGTTVEYQEYNLPRIAPLADHGTPMLANLQPAMDWLDRGFRSGNFGPGNCAG